MSRAQRIRGTMCPTGPFQFFLPLSLYPIPGVGPNAPLAAADKPGNTRAAVLSNALRSAYMSKRNGGGPGMKHPYPSLRQCLVDTESEAPSSRAGLTGLVPALLDTELHGHATCCSSCQTGSTSLPAASVKISLRLPYDPHLPYLMNMDQPAYRSPTEYKNSTGLASSPEPQHSDLRLPDIEQANEDSRRESPESRRLEVMTQAGCGR